MASFARRYLQSALLETYFVAWLKEIQLFVVSSYAALAVWPDCNFDISTIGTFHHSTHEANLKENIGNCGQSQGHHLHCRNNRRFRGHGPVGARPQGPRQRPRLT